MSHPEYYEDGHAEYFEDAHAGGSYEYFEDAHGPAEEFEDAHAAPSEYFEDGHAEYFEDGHAEEFEDGHAEEFEGPEEFSKKGKKGKRRSLGQYLKMLVRYLVEAAVLVAVLHLLTPSEQRNSIRELALMALTFAAVLLLLDMFGGMGLAARLGAGLGVGFRMAGVASVL